MPIFFPDVSHYQSGVSLMGAVACFAKATQGTSYIDPSYATFKADATRRGIVFAAYHWLDSTDAAAQARHCYQVVGDTPLMIDDEQARIDVPHTLAFVNAYRKLGGRVVLEYAPQWVWSASGRPDLTPLAKAGLFIVSSSYPGIGYTASGPGWNPYGGITPTVWQYTDKQSFNGRPVDFNAYRGSLADLKALLTGTTSEDDMATGPEVWATKINSPALGINDTAAEYLKFAPAASKTADKILAAVQALAATVTAPPAVDASAVAAALAANTVFLSALAKAVNDDAAARLKD